MLPEIIEHPREKASHLAAKAAIDVLSMRGFKDPQSLLRLIGELGMQALRPDAIVRLAQIQADMRAVENHRVYGVVSQ